MEKITITFLGTASAVPTKKRNHTAILLTYKNENILFDCGEGTQRQFRYAHLSPAKITKLCVTHWHGDHVFGLPGLFQTLAMNEIQSTLEFYGPKNTKKYLSVLNEFAKIKIPLNTKEIISGAVWENDECIIEALPMKHGAPTLAYSFKIKDKLRLDKKKLEKLKLPHSPLLKKLQQGEDIEIDGKEVKAADVTYEEKGRKIAIILDTLPNENAIKIAQDADLLICESSFTHEDENIANEYMHLTTTQAAQIAKDANAKTLVLTHISQRYEANTKPLLAEAKKVFKNTKIVNDLDVIVL